jgi:ABC-type multidrug transport system ATPase subunit
MPVPRRLGGLLSWLSDTPTFYEDLSLWEHLEFVARLHGVADWESSAEKLLERVGLEQRRDDIPTTFSRGLGRRRDLVGIRAPFQLLLVDEPFVGLDEPGKQALLMLFERRHSAARRW